MEGIYWLRVGAVVALILGSVWVLAPTFLQESAETRFGTAVDGVDTPGSKKIQLEVRLPVQQGDAAVLAPVVKARLDAAGVPTAKVDAGISIVTVTLSAGGDPTSVASLVARTGMPSLVGLDAVGPVPTPLPAPPATLPAHLEAVLSLVPPAELGFWAQVLPKAAGAPVPPAATPSSARLGSFNVVDSQLRATVVPDPSAPATSPFGAGQPFALLAVDGALRGAVVPDGRVFLLVSDADTEAVLVGGPLLGVLGPALAEAPATAATVGKDQVQKELTGIHRFLPNSYKIVFGLDLIGGIDLTLQVDLDEAVMSQVGRDLLSLKELATDEGLVVENVRRDYNLPILEITSASPLADLQSFVAKRSNDYEYVDTSDTKHRFRMRDTRQEEIRDQAVEQVLETLRKRVNATGVKEPSIARKGGGRIEVQLPGLDDVQTAIDAIGTTAVLEFHMVDAEFDRSKLAQALGEAEKAMPADQFLDDRLLNQWAWTNGKWPEERTVLWQYAVDAATSVEGRVEPHMVLSDVPLTGNDVSDAGVGWDQNNDPYVTLTFKPRGGQVFCDLTGKAVGKQFAIVLDGKVQSAPSIREQICGGQARIEMKSSDEPIKDSQTLALVLRTGALDAPVVVASVRQIGASLGRDAINQGTIAAVIGGLLVAAFMVLWYQTSGVVANIALLVNVLMMLASLALFGATLTLPGIAGIALTVGMAVDSNIIVYERIREELRLGVQARKAVDVGFEKALVAIVDANVTTGFAGIVMYSYGSGPLKGFAVTLLVGIVTTLVTAVFVTRTIMEVLTRSSSSRLRI